MTKTGLNTPYFPRAVLSMGAAGALIGGSVSVARNISRVKQGEMTREEAVKDALKEAGTTGLSTSTATAVVGALGLPGFVSLIGVVTVSVGAKYLTDEILRSRENRKALAEAKEQKKAAAKAPAKKTAAKAKKTAAKTETKPEKA